ncbi:hypothetical protein K490DRAFT_66377 [Saccharata proteae CBS 121410]|uniref:Uncharacterized protein n=1 Tax=Saccharata proteae CBS 121410 TaxID=1314787 RepID=A0A9P4LWK5_9PEZI|nr:hypothetical protein K490DRAFT_66377 [Saccharata proteae CBS 121410]
MRHFRALLALLRTDNDTTEPIEEGYEEVSIYEDETTRANAIDAAEVVWEVAKDTYEKQLREHVESTAEELCKGAKVAAVAAATSTATGFSFAYDSLSRAVIDGFKRTRLRSINDQTRAGLRRYKLKERAPADIDSEGVAGPLATVSPDSISHGVLLGNGSWSSSERILTDIRNPNDGAAGLASVGLESTPPGAQSQEDEGVNLQSSSNLHNQPLPQHGYSAQSSNDDNVNLVSYFELGHDSDSNDAGAEAIPFKTRTGSKQAEDNSLHLSVAGKVDLLLLEAADSARGMLDKAYERNDSGDS